MPEGSRTDLNISDDSRNNLAFGEISSDLLNGRCLAREILSKLFDEINVFDDRFDERCLEQLKMWTVLLRYTQADTAVICTWWSKDIDAQFIIYHGVECHVQRTAANDHKSVIGAAF